MIQRLRAWARRLKNDLVAVALAARDPRTPWSARFLAVAVVAYALSPIDLIPDAVPVLGLLDDLILVPLGLWLVIRLIPAPILEEHRRAAEVAGRLPQSRVAAVVIVMLWIALAAAGLAWLVR
jgi:uncharacterized membrane protein YkvA (DUF1232 family)